MAEYARRSGLSLKRYLDIERGNIEPTEDEFDAIHKAQTHVLKTFYEQIFDTRLDISGPLARNIPIDYYQYKIFRDKNPVPFTVHKQPEPLPDKPQAKILQLSSLS